MTAQTQHFPCRLRLLLKCDMDTSTSSLEVADVVGNLIAQIIYDAIYNSHSDIDDIKKSVNALLQLNQEVSMRHVRTQYQERDVGTFAA